MKFFKTSEERLAEDWVYEKVAEEIERNELRKGLWLKASADAMGDERKARAIYVRLRVQQFVDELNLKSRVEESAKQAAQKAYEESAEKARIDEARRRSELMRSSYTTNNPYSSGSQIAALLIFGGAVFALVIALALGWK